MVAAALKHGVITVMEGRSGTARETRRVLVEDRDGGTAALAAVRALRAAGFEPWVSSAGGYAARSRATAGVGDPGDAVATIAAGPPPGTEVAPACELYVQGLARNGEVVCTCHQRVIRSWHRSPSFSETIEPEVLEELPDFSRLLEWYLNNNFYGNLAYGIDTASKVYFGKPVHDLSLGEAAMLAAIPQNPQLNPIDNWVAARQRQAVVLDAMVSLGSITHDEATDALSKPILIQPVTERYGIIAPHFCDYAVQQSGGRSRIATTLDPRIQSIAEQQVRARVASLRAWGVEQAAVVVIDIRSREVVAMVGSAQFFDPTLHALDLGTGRVARSPRLLGMGGMTLAVPDRNLSLDLWDFAQIPVGLASDDTIRGGRV